MVSLGTSEFIVVLVVVGGGFSVVLSIVFYRLGARRKRNWPAYLLAIIAPALAFFYLRRAMLGILVLVLSLFVAIGRNIPNVSGLSTITTIVHLLVILATVLAVRHWLKMTTATVQKNQ